MPGAGGKRDSGTSRAGGGTENGLHFNPPPLDPKGDARTTPGSEDETQPGPKSSVQVKRLILAGAVGAIAGGALGAAFLAGPAGAVAGAIIGALVLIAVVYFGFNPIDKEE